MESSAVSNSDTYISISKLIFQLANGKVNLKRLPNIYLQKLLSTSCNASQINNYEEDKENQSKFYLHRDKNDGDITINNYGGYRTIRRKGGGATKDLMSAYCRDCDKNIVGIEKTYTKCEECNKKYCIFKCGKCSWNYTSFKSLKTHLYKVCNPVTEYRCCWCDYKCIRASEIQSHVRKHQLSSDLGDPESELHDTPIRCDLCPFTTSLKRHLLIHLKAKHPETVAAPPSEAEPKKIECRKCGRVFVNKTGLREHAVFCQKLPSMQCEFCPHRTYRTSMMKQHMKKMHPKFMQVESNRKNDKRRERKKANKKRVQNIEEELPYTVDRVKMDSRIMVKRVCQDCKKPHSKPRRHTICLSCEGTLQYVCTKCALTFPNYSKVKNHVRYACFGKTTYHCKKCNCSRTSKEYILNHISKAHGGDRIR